MGDGKDAKPCDVPTGTRRHVRVAAQLEVNYRIAGDGARAPGRALTRDVSHGGACLALFDCGDELLERLDGLPLLDIAIAGVATKSLRGRVEWLRRPEVAGGPALLGIEFSEVSPEDEIAIIDLIAHVLIKAEIGQTPVPSLPPTDTPLLLY